MTLRLPTDLHNDLERRMGAEGVKSLNQLIVTLLRWALKWKPLDLDVPPKERA